MLPILIVILASPFADPAAPTLDEAIGHALEHHPSLAKARAELRVARARVGATGWWPEPTLQVSGSPLPIETRNGPAWASAAVGQAFPWTGELDAQTEAASARARAAAAAVREAELALARDVHLAWAGLWLADERQAITRRTIELMARFVELAQGQLAVGKAPQTDVLLAQAELARLQNTLIDLEQRRVTRQAGLNFLLARPPTETIGPVPAPTARPAVALDALLEWARAHHPALARQRAQIEANRARLRAADYAGHPRFEVGVGYTFIGGGDPPAMGADDGRDALSIRAGMSLPLWRGRYAATSRAAAEAVDAAEAARAATEDLQVFRVVEQHVGVETALRQIRLLDGTLLPLARQHLELLEAAYASAETGLLKLIDAERALERFELERAEALARAERRMARLAHAVGRPGVEETEAGDGSD